jgi:hypothetical protein
MKLCANETPTETTKRAESQRLFRPKAIDSCDHVVQRAQNLSVLPVAVQKKSAQLFVEIRT